MKLKFQIVIIFMAICACKASSIKPEPKIEVVNPDYEILSVADKTRDGSRPLGWRCFLIKNVKVNYRTWRSVDSMETDDLGETMCDFEIFADSASIFNEYHGRRGKPLIYCNEFKAAWKKLTQGNKHICIDAESWNGFTSSEDKARKKPFMSWIWDKIKTEKGCYSFWDGYNC